MSELDALIDQTAQAHGLPPEIVRAVVLQESGGDAHAMRFEEGFYRRYILGRELDYIPHGCSRETEAVGRAISWGLMQIMGATARENGFRSWFTELCDPGVGLDCACRYLARLRDKFLTRGGWVGVLKAYNGGQGNWNDPANYYPDRVLLHIPGGAWPTTEARHV